MFVNSSSVKDLQNIYRYQRKEVFDASDSKLEETLQKKKETRRLVFVFVIAFVIFSVAVTFKIDSLKTEWTQAYEWWESPLGYNSTSYPNPMGSNNITVQSAAICASYPLLSQAMGLTFQISPISQPQADFLLGMVSQFGISHHLAAVHWNGSQEQLRFKYIETFFPTENGAYLQSTDSAGKTTSTPNWEFIWWSFAAETSSGKSANPWFGTLWPTVEDFKGSPAVQDYYSTPSNKNAINALYRGGLCEVALSISDSTSTGSSMIQYLMGVKSTRVPGECTQLQKANKAIQNTFMAAGIGSIGIPFGIRGVLGLGVIFGSSCIYGLFSSGLVTRNNSTCGYTYSNTDTPTPT